MSKRYRSASLVGIDKLLDDLSSCAVVIEHGLVAAVRAATEATLREAKRRAPVGKRDGGGVREALASHYFDGGLVGSVFVGPTRDPRTNRVRAKNLPIWLEYGTRRADARTFLVPAGEAQARTFDAACVRVVTAATKAVA